MAVIELGKGLGVVTGLPGQHLIIPGGRISRPGLSGWHIWVIVHSGDSSQDKDRCAHAVVLFSMSTFTIK